MRFKVCAALVVAAFIFPGISSADESVAKTPPVMLTKPVDPSKDSVTLGIKQGQVAPFTGVLLSPKAVADIIVKQDELKKQAELDKQKALADQKVEDDAKLKEAQTAASVDATACDQRIKLRDDNLAKTEKDLETARSAQTSPTMWAAIGGVVGVVVGTAVTILVVGLAHGI